MRALADRTIHRNANGVRTNQFFQDERSYLKIRLGTDINKWVHGPIFKPLFGPEIDLNCRCFIGCRHRGATGGSIDSMSADGATSSTVRLMLAPRRHPKV